ncbi:MAG: DUF447 family protein [Bdellovibrio sp.]|nr:DUF447 family protein [Methylotenera sp.]
MIFETIIITQDADETPHVTPFGVRYEDEKVIIAPYKPSTTLNNILANHFAVMNVTDDVRVFAGALTGHNNWPLVPVSKNPRSKNFGFSLANCLAHTLLELIEVRDDLQRPQLVMKTVKTVNHINHNNQHNQALKGFNRAQAAVIELSILFSRLQLLPKEKVLTERAYLQIAIDKTAGERELEAWAWLTEKIEHFYANN